MKRIAVLAVTALALVLLGLLPLGMDAAWAEGRFSLALRIWFLDIRLGGAKKERPAQEKPESEPDEKSGPIRKLPPRPVLKLLVKHGYPTLCRIVSRLRTELLRIHFTAAFDDPYTTAMAYAAAGTAMEGLIRIGGGRILRPDLRADVDFDRGTPVVDFRIRITIRVHQLLGAALGFGFGFLKDYWHYKKECA